MSVISYKSRALACITSFILASYYKIKNKTTTEEPYSMDQQASQEQYHYYEQHLTIWVPENNNNHQNITKAVTPRPLFSVPECTFHFHITQWQVAFYQ